MPCFKRREKDCGAALDAQALTHENIWGARNVNPNGRLAFRVNDNCCSTMQ